MKLLDFGVREWHQLSVPADCQVALCTGEIDMPSPIHTTPMYWQALGWSPNSDPLCGELGQLVRAAATTCGEAVLELGRWGFATQQVAGPSGATDHEAGETTAAEAFGTWQYLAKQLADNPDCDSQAS